MAGKHTVTFLNGDGQAFDTQLLAKGSTPTDPAAGDNKPTKVVTPDDGYTYTFNKWDKDTTAVGDEDVTYTPEFSKTAKSYQLTFEVNGGDWVQSYTAPATYTYNPESATALPTVENITLAGHTLKGWKMKDGTIVTEIAAGTMLDRTFTAEWEKNKYKIKWSINGLETSEEYSYGDMPSYKNGTPEKAADAQYTYTFTTWSPALSTVTATQTYEAQFSQTKKQYTITKAEISDGNSYTVSAATSDWGETITITPSAAEGYELTALTVTGATTDYSIATTGITKVGDTYTFTMPTENVTVTPTFEATAPVVQQYTVTYKGTATGGIYSVTGVTSGTKVDENTVITIVPVADAATGYEIDAVYAYNTGSTKTDNDKITDNGGYTYTVTTDTTVEVTFKKLKYTITWKNWNGQVLTTTEVEHGTVPEYPQNATAPTKESDGEYDYSFKDWSPELTVATAAAEYTATYTSISKEAPKTYLDLLTGFSWLKIEKKATAEGNDVVLTVTKDESSQEEIPALKAYIAVYDGGVLQSVKPYTFTSNTVTLPASEATDDYKIFIWTDKYEPVITPITAETAGNNKLF